MDKRYLISDEKALEAALGEPMEFVRVKLRTELDDVMREFIGRSPLVIVSTIDSDGHVDVSPKGDPAGFVEVDDKGNLLIPERPGNRLTFGFRNILRNGEIGLIFLVPHQRETLRVKGTATLHNDPEILKRLQAGGKPALLYTYVEVKECFIHCGKALIRSKLWQPEMWGEFKESLAARQFSQILGVGGENSVRETEQRLEKVYKEELY